MSVVPRTLVDKLQFFESRLGPWGERAEQIGTTDAEVAALASFAAEAREAFRAQAAAQAAARSATMRFNAAMGKLATAGAGIIAQVRVRAMTSDDDGVYPLALIPAPAKASPIGAPGQPTRFTFKLFQSGSLELRWDCDHPRGAVGTIYHVWRKNHIDLGPDGWTFLGSAGERRIIDHAPPAGADIVLYKVQAVRSTGNGPEAFYHLSLGTRGGASTPPSVQPARAAA